MTTAAQGFRDRADAGRRLGRLVEERKLADPLVLALPRGGVPVGFEVARAVGAPLDVFVARKIGAPQRPEYGIGAIAEDDMCVIDRGVAQALRIDEEALGRVVAAERHELDRRVRLYRQGRGLPAFEGRDVVLVDDGLATGVTAEAALRALRTRTPRTLLLAVPVCVPATAHRLRAAADDVICVESPPRLFAVGQWYDNFTQTTDAEVLRLLELASSERAILRG